MSTASNIVSGISLDPKTSFAGRAQLQRRSACAWLSLSGAQRTAQIQIV